MTSTTRTHKQKSERASERAQPAPVNSSSSSKGQRSISSRWCGDTLAKPLFTLSTTTTTTTTTKMEKEEERRLLITISPTFAKPKGLVPIRQTSFLALFYTECVCVCVCLCLCLSSIINTKREEEEKRERLGGGAGDIYRIGQAGGKRWGR